MGSKDWVGIVDDEAANYGGWTLDELYILARANRLPTYSLRGVPKVKFFLFVDIDALGHKGRWTGGLPVVRKPRKKPAAKAPSKPAAKAPSKPADAELATNARAALEKLLAKGIEAPATEDRRPMVASDPIPELALNAEYDELRFFPRARLDEILIHMELIDALGLRTRPRIADVIVKERARRQKEARDKLAEEEAAAPKNITPLRRKGINGKRVRFSDGHLNA